ncbi:MAG: hypothetical protein IT337_18170, partial [Thermomicrobiales bacterium]|nr:hypothetical protein [Thermomicrobiales bacterium]
MTTPTFPAPPPNPDDAEEESFAPAERGTGALDAFAAGHVAAADVARLSDLDRRAAARFQTEWFVLPEPVRERIVREMGELAEDRVELNFGRALRVALADASPVVRQLAVAALWEDERDDLPDLLRGVLATDRSQ